MPSAEFFTRLGLLNVRDFFDAELCSKVLAEMRSATATPAVVGSEGGDYVVDENLRRTKEAIVSDATTSLVKTRLLALQPALEKHYNVTITDLQEPQFLVYREGDFFHAHADRRRDTDAPGFSKERKVSAVIFLNGEAEVPGPDVYGGGSLTFYGLMGDPRLKGHGLPLTGEPGLLVTFRPELVHEVTPVTHGERYTIVSWFQ